MEYERIRHVLKKFIKGILYLILLILFVNFYFTDELKNYMKGSTTLSSRTEKVEFLEAPYITLCFQPIFKPSMLLKHGLSNDIKNPLNLFEALGVGWFDMETFENFSYQYEKDFDITLLYEDKSIEPDVLINFQIQKVVIFRHGLCYLIKHNANLSLNVYFVLDFSYKGQDLDKPESAKVLLSSPQGWYGIVLDEWQMLDPTMLTIPIELLHEQSWVTVVSQTDYFYMTGTEDFEQCLLEKITRNSECKTKCYPFLFNFLPNYPPCDAEEWESFECMWNMFVGTKKYRYGCLQSKKIVRYKTSSTYPNQIGKYNASKFSLMFNSDKEAKDVKEEVLVVTAGSFIGSVGGSLGLFLGFSIFPYLSGIIDKILQ